MTFLVAGLVGGPVPSSAQTIVPLIEFTNQWRYDSSGSDLGTGWRTNDYDDSGWSIGRGLFQTGETTPYPAPFSTILPELGQGQRITDYFRTEFDVPAEVMNDQFYLVATNLVDDGCVIYLNGVRAGQIRMSLATPTYLTFSAGSPALEGQFDVLIFPWALLHPGRNLLAVEVHQASATSSDAVWGTKLVAVRDQPLTITRQPVGGTHVSGETFVLSATITGTPAYYQWRKDGANIVGATNFVLSFPNLSTNQSGAYELVATNRSHSVTSSVAQLLIVPDRTGPSVASATAVLNSIRNQTNLVDLIFNERVFLTRNPQLFSITHLFTGERVNVTNVIFTAEIVRLMIDDSNLHLFEDYFVTASGVQDLAGNAMAPATAIPLSWVRPTNVFSWNQVWQYHAAAAFNPEVYNEPWTARHYQPGPWWAEGRGVFYNLPGSSVPCAGALETSLGFQREPVLFRHWFHWPEGLPPVATLRFRFLIDDAAVVFLNGAEIHRRGVGSEPVTAASIAGTPVLVPACTTEINVAVSNLVSGENLLAVALIQAPETFLDALFDLEMNANYVFTPVLPNTPPPVLTITPTGLNTASISWPGGGYALEESTNIMDRGSYPFGAWTEVTNMSNPSLQSLDGPFRAFRLKKK